MARARGAWIAVAVCALTVVAVVLARSSLFAHSSTQSGLCARELRPDSPASISLTAEATSQSQALARATPAGTPPTGTVDQSKAIAQARSAGGISVVVTVDDQSITLGELRAQEVIVHQLLAQMEEELVVQAFPPGFAQDFAKRITLIKQAGVPNVALAGLISDDAIYQYAVGQGCEPSPTEIATRVAHDRKLADEGRDPGLSGYALTYGPAYWTTIYPETIRQLLAKNRLNASLTASLVPPPLSTAEATAPATAWNSLNERVLPQAHISVKNSVAIAPATVSGALAYLKKYYAAGFGQ